MKVIIDRNTYVLSEGQFTGKGPDADMLNILLQQNEDELFVTLPTYQAQVRDIVLATFSDARIVVDRLPKSEEGVVY